MKGVRSFNEDLKERLKDPEFKKAFDEEEIYANVAIQIAMIRQKQGISQKKLAKLLNTSQQMISRIENPHNRSFSLHTLVKLAQAFHKELRIQFV